MLPSIQILIFKQINQPIPVCSFFAHTGIQTNKPMKTIQELSISLKKIKMFFKEIDYPYYKLYIDRKKVKVQLHFQDVDWIANGIYTKLAFSKIKIYISSIEIYF